MIKDRFSEFRCGHTCPREAERFEHSIKGASPDKIERNSEYDVGLRDRRSHRQIT